MHPLDDHTQSKAIVNHARHESNPAFTSKTPLRERTPLGQIDLQRDFVALLDRTCGNRPLPQTDNRQMPADAFRPNRERSGNKSPKLQPGWQLQLGDQSLLSLQALSKFQLWDGPSPYVVCLSS